PEELAAIGVDPHARAAGLVETRELHDARAAADVGAHRPCPVGVAADRSMPAEHHLGADLERTVRGLSARVRQRAGERLELARRLGADREVARTPEEAASVDVEPDTRAAAGVDAAQARDA